MSTMELTQKHKIIIASLIIVISIGLFSVLNKKTDVTKNIDSVDTVTSSGVVIGAEGTGSYTIKQVPLTEGKVTSVAAPDLSRPVTFGQSAVFTPEVVQLLTNKIITLQVDLKKDSTDLKKWIDLGIYQKMIGDYQGAVASWQYVTKVADKDFIASGNLGNMYAYQLKDMVKAEQYYNQAIKNAPTQIYLYFQLAEAFRDVSKDIPRAKAVVERGLVANPGNTELVALRDSLK